MAATTLILVLVLKRIKQTEKMASISALILMSVVVYVLQLSVELVGDIADIPSRLPAPMLPDFSLIPQLTLGSISVAIVALVQGAGISTAYPNPDGSKSSQNRDFIGEGLGNLFGSFFQSMATGGSLYGPLTLATDLIVFNVTKENFRVREAIVNPKPGRRRPPRRQSHRIIRC